MWGGELRQQGHLGSTRLRNSNAKPTEEKLHDSRKRHRLCCLDASTKHPEDLLFVALARRENGVIDQQSDMMQPARRIEDHTVHAWVASLLRRTRIHYCHCRNVVHKPLENAQSVSERWWHPFARMKEGREGCVRTVKSDPSRS
jgi:hypothetical protein